MTRRNLEGMSKAELILELEKLEASENQTAATVGEADRERLIHDLNVHQVELEMQNRELREAQLRLEEARARYMDLYDFAPVGYCTLDPEGQIRELNLTAARLFGSSRDTLLGRPFRSIVPLKDKHRFQAHMKRCSSEGGRVTSELLFARGTRETRTVQIISDPVRDPGGATTAYRTSLVDISDLKALEERLRLLSVAGDRLASSLEYPAAIEEAASIAVPGLSDICIIDMASESGSIERKLVRFSDPDKQSTLADRLMRFTPRPGWQTPQSRVIASGEPLLLSEIGVELRERISYDDGDADVLRDADIRSLMVVPLNARGKTFGALTLAAAESDRRYSLLDLQVAQDLSSRIATALDNIRLYDDSLRANRELRLSEAKSSGIVSISVDAIISVDEDQRITMFNEGAEKIFGYSKEEALGAPLDTLLPDRSRDAHRHHVQRFATGSEASRAMSSRNAIIFGLRKNGEEFPAEAGISKLDVGGTRIFTVALRDVTEQKRVEADQRFLAEMGSALAATLDYEETLTSITQLVVRALADFCILDLVDEDGEVQRVRVRARDPSMEQICALLRQNHIEQRPPQLIWSTMDTREPTLIEFVTPEVVDSWSQNDEHRQLLQRLGPRSVMVVPLLARGKLLGVIKFVSTPLRTYRQADLRLATAVAAMAAQATENARLYRVAERAILARDNVLGIVAHDLRNPLGIILMQAALFRPHKGEPDRRSRRPAEAIERAAIRMKHLIQDLLDVTSIEAGRLSLDLARVDAGQIIADFVAAQEPLTSSKSLELRLDLAGDLGDVSADRERLLQVLENIVGNAVKFTNAGGRITIGATRREGELIIWIADTGPGLPPEALPHLFDRFWQARKVGRQGVGLGLPIVKGIVEAHGGRVWIQSQVGIGSKFFFSLPLAPPEPKVSVTRDRAV